MQKRFHVLGVGDSGVNIVNRMIQEGINRPEYIIINSNANSVYSAHARNRLLIGNGSGAGGMPRVGERFANEQEIEIFDMLKGVQTLYLVGGMGGGTSTGAAPIIAKLALKAGASHVVAVVTTPFGFEGDHRGALAKAGVLALREFAHSVTVIPCNSLLSLIRKDPTLRQLYQLVDGAVMWRVAEMLL